MQIPLKVTKIFFVHFVVETTWFGKHPISNSEQMAAAFWKNSKRIPKPSDFSVEITEEF